MQAVKSFCTSRGAESGSTLTTEKEKKTDTVDKNQLWFCNVLNKPKKFVRRSSTSVSVIHGNNLTTSKTTLKGITLSVCKTIRKRDIYGKPLEHLYRQKCSNFTPLWHWRTPNAPLNFKKKILSQGKRRESNKSSKGILTSRLFFFPKSMCIPRCSTLCLSTCSSKSVPGQFSANCSMTAELSFQQPKPGKEKERDIIQKMSNQPINEMDMYINSRTKPKRAACCYIFKQKINILQLRWQINKFQSVWLTKAHSRANLG